tara:strand:- start:8869 stop:9249 length:381 start_codon:yes stop_codon:yes gene_type:complete
MTASIYQQWLNAKAVETAAIKARRDLEDEMVKTFGVAETLEGTVNFDADTYQVKIEGRINRKINADKLQELAAENGLTEHLASLFRWKPEINAYAWRAAKPEITTPLLDAITATPGRPSFTITIKE